MALHPCPACGRSCLGVGDDPRCGVCRAQERHQAERTRTRGGPRPGRAKAPTQRRACLRCDREFWSQGCHHRLCDACRHALQAGEGAERTYRVMTGRYLPEPGA